MADLRLNILGDGKGATEAIDKVKNGIAGLGAGLVAFSALSVKAFEEQEQADRKLAAVAGSATEALKKQAAAIQDATGTSDDMVQEMQRMLLTYGQAPAAIDETIKAVLNMSAATGQDAVQAISELTSKTTTGRKAFIELGLEYDNTGTRGEVLAHATQALGKKFAGASETESESLAGTVRKARAQFGELQESWGGLIAEFVTKSGVVSGLAEFFKNLNAAVFSKDGYTDKQKKIIEMSDAISRLRSEYRDAKDLNKPGSVLFEISENIDRLQAKVEELNNTPVIALKSTGAADGLRAGKGNSDAENAKEAMERVMEAQNKLRVKAQKDDENAADAAEKLAGQFAKKTQDQADRKVRVLHAAREKERNALDAEEKREESEYKRKREKEKHDLEERRRDYEQAGAAIGGAFANALSSALSQLAEGGEIDAVSMTADILGAVVSAAVSLIPGFGAFAGIAGSLAGTGVRAIGAAAGGGPKRRRHDGGWAGDGMSRYHLGTWVGPDEEAAILQNGERVVSRSEVSAMGGPRGVEKAINGRGGGGVVNIQTFDAGSFREIFSGRGRQGLIDAQRTGHGVASFFGGR